MHVNKQIHPFIVLHIYIQSSRLKPLYILCS